MLDISFHALLIFVQENVRKEKNRFILQVLQEQFTILFHRKVSSKSRNISRYFCVYVKSLDTGNKALAELVSIIITHMVVSYFFFHGTHGYSPETFGLLLYLNILQSRGRWEFSPFL